MKKVIILIIAIAATQILKAQLTSKNRTDVRISGKVNCNCKIFLLDAKDEFFQFFPNSNDVRYTFREDVNRLKIVCPKMKELLFNIQFYDEVNGYYQILLDVKKPQLKFIANKIIKPVIPIQ